MNENSPRKMQTLKDWLDDATASLKKAAITSPSLDAELILTHTIRRSRTYLHAHCDEILSDRHKDIANARLQMRLEYTPIAYIIGHKEFYGRQFKTTPAALIPRPESEMIIELLDEIIPKQPELIPRKQELIDIGTGTGCLGITAKLEWPTLNVTLTDISTHALNLARENARLLNADVNFRKNDLLRGYTITPADIIVANLPYVDSEWEVSLETNSEPQLALYAKKHGLALIFQLIEQASLLQKDGGHLLLESDVRQHVAIISYAGKHAYKHRKTSGLITYFTQEKTD